MAIIDKIFAAAAKLGASDIHIVPGEPFILRKIGVLKKMKSNRLTPETTRQVVFEILKEDQQQQRTTGRDNGNRPPDHAQSGYSQDTQSSKNKTQS